MTDHAARERQKLRNRGKLVSDKENGRNMRWALAS